MSKSLYADELEHKIYKVESEYNEDRINKINQLIRSDHLNEEEKPFSKYVNNILRYFM